MNAELFGLNIDTLSFKEALDKATKDVLDHGAKVYAFDLLPDDEANDIISCNVTDKELIKACKAGTSNRS